MQPALVLTDPEPLTIEVLIARAKACDEKIVRIKERIDRLHNGILAAYASANGSDASVISDRRKLNEQREALKFEQDARAILEQQIADMRDAEGVAQRRQQGKAVDDACAAFVMAADSFQRWLSKYTKLHEAVVLAEAAVWTSAAGFTGLSAKPMEYSNSLPQRTALALYAAEGSSFPIPRQVSLDSKSQLREQGLCDVSAGAWKLHELVLKEIGYKPQTKHTGE